jgi:hypothetical protein
VESEAPGADRRAAATVAAALREAGYTRDGLRGALGAVGDVIARRGHRPVALRRLEEAGALAVPARLFLLDSDTPVDEVERALGSEPLAALVELRLVEEEAGTLRGTVRLVPQGDLLIASDLPEEGGRPDHVAGVHRPSVTLSDLTIRRPVERALDMGTGCGIQALLAADHAERVVATDVNERALAFAALNAALNGVENVELRAGSFFEPVAGERFGLVVSNPPYVISPESSFLFRDSGLGRDRVSERLVGELPAFLEPGGFGTITGSWVEEGESLARPLAWLEGSGCDVWLFHTGTEAVLDTAAAWNLDREGDEEDYADSVDRWLGYFRAEGIERIGYGAFVLRRRDGETWVRTHEFPDRDRQGTAPHVLRLFENADALARLGGEEALLGARLALVPGAVVEMRARHDEDGWEEDWALGLAEGIPFVAELDRVTASFVGALDGSRPLGELLGDLAAASDEPERVRESGLRVARELLELGFATIEPETPRTA